MSAARIRPKLGEEEGVMPAFDWTDDSDSESASEGDPDEDDGPEDK